MHVSDVADALVRMTGTKGIFNIATGREATVQELWDLIKTESGSDAEPEMAPLRDGELERSGLDASAATEAIGWSAQVAIEQGVPETYRALVEEFEPGG